MPTFTVHSRDDECIEFLPVARGGRIKIKVEAEAPVYAYIVDDEGLEEYDAGDSFTTLAGGDTARTRHLLSAFIPSKTEFYLLIVNHRTTPVAAHWEIVK